MDMSSSPHWTISPETKGNLILFGWFMGNVLCLAAIVVIRDWAKRLRNWWLLLLAVPPSAVLAYQAWVFSKAFIIEMLREWRAVLILAWILLTLYLWMRGNDYRERARSADYALSRQPSRCPNCGAHLDRETQGKMLTETQQELACNKQADTGRAAAMLAIMRDPALLSRFKTADAKTQQQMIEEATKGLEGG